MSVIPAVRVNTMPLRRVRGAGLGNRAAIPFELPFDRYVASDGVGSGPGTIGAPWSLAYAKAGAGGTIASDVARSAPNNHCYIGVRGGTYPILSQLDFSTSCAGTLGSGIDNIDGKVIFKAVNGERWIINATDADGGDHSYDCIRNVVNYLWIWGVELYWSGWAVRSNVPLHVLGFYLSQGTAGGSKFIHCIAHDCDNGFGAEYWTAPTADNEFYGCIAYNNGVSVSQFGHGFYVRHDTTNNAYVDVRACIAFDGFGLNYQFYDQTAGLNHQRLLDCIGFNGGMRRTEGGGQEFVCYTPNDSPHDIAVLRNRFFKHSTDVGPILESIGKAADTANNIEIGDNYCVSKGGGHVLDVDAGFPTQSSFSVHGNVGVTTGTIVKVTDAGTLAYVWRNNDWHRNPLSGGWTPGTSWATFKSTTGLGTEVGYEDTASASDPTDTIVYVTAANKYEPGRAHICYYDWGNLAGSLGYISANVSTILNTGDAYAVYDVRDLVTPVLSGTYAGADLHLPITQKSPATIIGGPAGNIPPDTAPFFNVFVLRRTA